MTEWWQEQDQDNNWIRSMLEDEELQSKFYQKMDAGLSDEERVKIHETQWSK